MIVFDIPYPASKAGKAAFCRRYGLNAYYAGKHWTKRKVDAEELHELTAACMKKAGIKKSPLNNPVRITFWFNDGLDCSNHAVLIKAIEDAMKGWIIKDDRRKYVKSITASFHGGDFIRVFVEEIT